MSTPKIGIVSGIGPLAGADVFTKVIRHAAQKYGALEDCDYPDVVLLNHGIPGVDNTAQTSNEFEQGVVDMVYELEKHGATIIGIACNTAYIYLDKLITKPDTVVINLIDAVAQKAAAEASKYLLLTSASTKQSRLYHSYLQHHGVLFEETTDAQQGLVDSAIGQVMAHHVDAAQASIGRLLDAIDPGRKLGLIAGCTELPIAMVEAIAGLSGQAYIDSNSVLAAALVDTYFAALTTNDPNEVK